PTGFRPGAQMPVLQVAGRRLTLNPPSGSPEAWRDYQRRRNTSISENQLESKSSANGVQTPSSFSELHERYHYRLLCGMLTIVRNEEAAQDITATAFATAFERRDQFHGESSFYTWLYAIAANIARRWLSARRTVSLDALEGPELEALTVSDATLGNL